MKKVKRLIGHLFSYLEERNFIKALNIDDEKKQEMCRSRGIGYDQHCDLLNDCSRYAYRKMKNKKRDGDLEQYYFWKYYWSENINIKINRFIAYLFL